MKCFTSVVVLLVALSASLSSGQARAADYVFVVDSTADKIDADLLDEECNASVNDDEPECTLRAAVMQGNNIASPNSVVILLEADKSYDLAIPGGAEQESLQGDLDLHRPMTIKTANPDEGRAEIKTTANDRLLHLHPGAQSSFFLDLVLSSGTPANKRGNVMFVEIGEARKTGLSRVLTSSSHASPDTAGCEIDIEDGALFIESSNVRGGDGTGICVSGANAFVSLENTSVVYHDDAGIEVSMGGVARMTNSVVGRNGGPGIHIVGSGSDVSIRASTVAENEDVELRTLVSDYVMDIVGSVIGNGDEASCVLPNMVSTVAEWSVFSQDCFPALTSNVLVADAQLVFDSDHLRPGPASPAVDFVPQTESICAGNSADQLHEPRPSGMVAPYRCDAGSIELQFPPIFSDSFETD